MKWADGRQGVPLASYTSWLVGGPAEYFFEPKTIDDLRDIQHLTLEKNLPLTILGGGTNVLISDSGLKGVVMSLRSFSGIEVVHEGVPGSDFEFRALSGTNKSELLKAFLKRKLAPACFLAGLPGQVGGGVVMNAGVSEDLRPREFHEIVRGVEVLRPDGNLDVLEAADLVWNYRHCSGWRPGIIARVSFSWPFEPDEELTTMVRKLNQVRLRKQPLEWPSCGSVFRNPLPHRAGKLIEDAGLKGFSVGGAQISEKHANFIVNKGGATARDVKSLMETCIQRVKEKSGIDLVSEVVCLGKF